MNIELNFYLFYQMFNENIVDYLSLEASAYFIVQFPYFCLLQVRLMLFIYLFMCLLYFKNIKLHDLIKKINF